jgi:hypothetical protein
MEKVPGKGKSNEDLIWIGMEKAIVSCEFCFEVFY